MGLFLAIEGGDHVGKTSLVVPALTQTLNAVGIDTISSREPGGTPKGEAIREEIFRRLPEGATPDELAELFNRARKIHLEEIVIPRLGKDRTRRAVVILDRFALSTIVYQGLEGGVSLDRLRELDAEATNGYHPDLILLLYFPERRFHRILSARRQIAEASKGSDGRSHTAWDEGDTSQHLRRQRHYEKAVGILKDWGILSEIVMIDASRSPRTVMKDVLDTVNPRLEYPDGTSSDPAIRRQKLEDAFSIYMKSRDYSKVYSSWVDQRRIISENK